MTSTISAVRLPGESDGVLELCDPVAMGTLVGAKIVVGSKVGVKVGTAVHVEVTVTDTGTSLIAPEIVSITY